MSRAPTGDVLDAVPDEVQAKIKRALADIKRLTSEKQGYKRLGLGDRFDEELDALLAPKQAVLDEFRRICARKGIEADAVIAALGED